MDFSEKWNFLLFLWPGGGYNGGETRKKVWEMELLPLTAEFDAAMAQIVRENLKAHALDIPGTAYFDESLNHLSRYYAAPGRGYWVLWDGALLGGAGLAETDVLPQFAEMQKLYLADEAKGRGLGRRLAEHVEAMAREMGYRGLYLETHTNLTAALALYEKLGYRQIDRPGSVVHGTMNRFLVKKW